MCEKFSCGSFVWFLLFVFVFDKEYYRVNKILKVVGGEVEWF